MGSNLVCAYVSHLSPNTREGQVSRKRKEEKKNRLDLIAVARWSRAYLSCLHRTPIQTVPRSLRLNNIRHCFPSVCLRSFLVFSVFLLVVNSLLPSVGSDLKFAAMATSRTLRFFPLLLLVTFLWSTNALPVGTESNEVQNSSAAERGQDILDSRTDDVDSQTDDVNAASLSSDESEEDPNTHLARSRQRRYVFQTLIVVRSPISSKLVVIDRLCLSVACGCPTSDERCAKRKDMLNCAFKHQCHY